MYIKYNILCHLFASSYKKGYNMDMKIEDVIKENEYQRIKSMLNKADDYFTKEEFINLMQFLMQRQEKVVKNEEKI